MMNELMGKVHFWGSFVCMNLIFAPMFIQGLVGINRRMYDGGIEYAHTQGYEGLSILQGWAAWAMFAFQIVFIVNFFLSMKAGRKVGANPWDATTLEWAAAPSPPGHGNFPHPPEVFRGPYEYSVPGAARDFTPQNEPDRGPGMPAPVTQPAGAH
jgi:cytochrome c oxidase subunit 1